LAPPALGVVGTPRRMGALEDHQPDRGSLPHHQAGPRGRAASPRGGRRDGTQRVGVYWAIGRGKINLVRLVYRKRRVRPQRRATHPPKGGGRNPHLRYSLAGNRPSGEEPIGPLDSAVLEPPRRRRPCPPPTSRPGRPSRGAAAMFPAM